MLIIFNNQKHINQSPSFIKYESLLCKYASQVALVVKNLPANAGDVRDAGSISESEDLWRRAWQLTPVFLLGESHRQRSLTGYGP